MKRFAGFVVLVLLAGCGGGGGGSAGGGGNQQQLIIRSAVVANAASFTPTQHCVEDCWAACAQSVVSSYGAGKFYPSQVPSIQEAFAVKMFGPDWTTNCRPASMDMIAAALNDRYISTSGTQAFGLNGYTVPVDGISREVAKRLVDLVKGGHTFIIGVHTPNGAAHAMVVKGMTWQEDTAGNIVRFTGADLIDPWPLDWYAAFGIAPLPTTVNINTPLDIVAVTWAEPTDNPGSPPPPA